MCYILQKASQKFFGIFFHDIMSLSELFVYYSSGNTDYFSCLLQFFHYYVYTLTFTQPVALNICFHVLHLPVRSILKLEIQMMLQFVKDTSEPNAAEVLTDELLKWPHRPIDCVCLAID